MSSLDDRIRSVLDRTLESLTPRLEADLRDSATEIARVVSEHEGRVAEEAADAARVETRAEVERDVSALREEAERQVAVVQRVLDELRDEQAREAEASRRRLAEARQELATTRDELAALRQERGEAGEVAHRLEQALLRSEALPTALRSLDEAGSFGDVLDALARLAGEEAGRAVVFLVKGDRLTDWRTTGFEAGDAQPPVMTLELEDAGLLGEVARSGRAHERAGEVGPALPTFAADDGVRHAVGLPVAVGSSVIAVLYADAPPGTGDPGRWPDRLELMTRHAGRVLEALTFRQAATRWARQPRRA